MRSLAIVGAAGFVGTRLVEMLVLAGERDFTPIVRNNRNVAKLCRFGSLANLQFADATDAEALAQVLDGHEVVVNLVSGVPDDIRKSTRAIVHACRKVRVKRLIHLSSAVVFGTLKSPDIRDDSPPLSLEELWSPYARAKADAETFLREKGNCLGVEAIVLRPGIVWGPKSYWISEAASALKHGAAYLIGEGQGICNTVYVDNLVGYVLSAVAVAGDGLVSGFYNVSDREEITWRDFYGALAPACGFHMDKIAKIPGDRFRPSPAMRLQQLKTTPLYGRLKELVTPENRAAVKSRLKALSPSSATSMLPDAVVATRPPEVTREMWDLQKVAYKLANGKFRARFGFEPPVTFREGIRRSVEWLQFTGLI